MELNGIFNIIKPAGFTSHDVVAIVRKKLSMKKVGHLGTLDPMATGVLPVAVGNSTRAMDFLDMDIKTYKCKAVLGLGSETYDIWGENFSTKELPQLTQESLNEFFCSYTGVVDQRPPIYSALKKNGKKLYEYARAGQDISIETRKIYIKEIKGKLREKQLTLEELQVYNPKADLNTFENQSFLAVDFQVSCSKGTYIRSICYDMGQYFSSLGLMISLVRVESGIFSYDNAIGLEEFKDLSSQELEEKIIPAHQALENLGIVEIPLAEGVKYRNGGKISQRSFIKKLDVPGQTQVWPLELGQVMKNGYRVFTQDGNFLGVGVLMENGSLRPYKSMG